MSKMLKTSVICSLLVVSSYSFAICTSWTSAQVGSLDKKIINEASGLVASSLQADKYIWSNDSGNNAELFATGKDGKVTRTVRLNGTSNEDSEALAIGPCPSNKADSCIYVGDIGDGMGWRSSFEIAIFKESDFWAKTSISPEKTIKYSASSTNAESMVVTHEGKIIIFSKHESGISKILLIDSVTGKLTTPGQIDLNAMIAGARGKGPRITDASLSPEGDKVLLLTYGDILEVNMATLISTPSKQWRKGVDFNVIKSPGLPQQETIAYANSDKAFIVSSESPNGEVPPVFLYSCKN